MCLGVPGQLTTIVSEQQKLAMAEVSGVSVEVNLACVMTEGQTVADLLGSWVLIHVGFAMSLIDEQEAQITLDMLAQAGALQTEQEEIMRSASTVGKEN
jgi:hydrogenase expression/formation protein HypC